MEILSISHNSPFFLTPTVVKEDDFANSYKPVAGGKP